MSEDVQFLTIFFPNLVKQCVQWRTALQQFDVRLIVLLWVCLHMYAHTLEQFPSLLIAADAKST